MTVSVERRGRVLVVRLDRPSRRNAIDRATAEALEAALDLLEDDPALWAGVLAGGPPVFCAGTDLAARDDLRMPRGGEYGVVRRRRDKPLVAAVDGAALGGGMEIVLACDLVVAAEDATFGLPETRRGVVATCGALFRTQRALPPNVARELLLTGRALGAARAERLGLVNQVVPAGSALDAACALAEEVCRSSPASVRETMRALRGVDAEHEARGWQATATAIEAVLASQDLAEGIAAFLEKREPRWHDPATTQEDR